MYCILVYSIVLVQGAIHRIPAELFTEGPDWIAYRGAAKELLVEVQHWEEELNRVACK